MDRSIASHSQIPAYVINLDRSPDRLQRVTEAFGRFGIRLQQFRAIDARQQDRLIEESFARTAFEAHMRRRAARGEIGCALSHFAVWDMLAESGHECMLVVEDDAVPTQNITKLEGALPSLPADWDILLLFDDGKLPIYSARAGELKIKRYLKPGYYAIGYVVHRRILRHRRAWGGDRPVRFALDAWRFWSWEHGFSIYCVDEAVVALPADSQSTIGLRAPERGRFGLRHSPATAARAVVLRIGIYPRAIVRSLATLFYLHVVRRLSGFIRRSS